MVCSNRQFILLGLGHGFKNHTFQESAKLQTLRGRSQFYTITAALFTSSSFQGDTFAPGSRNINTISNGILPDTYHLTAAYRSLHPFVLSVLRQPERLRRRIELKRLNRLHARDGGLDPRLREPWCCVTEDMQID